ncbi:hypothetical protein DHW03_12720 [Pedobacter yonginense]|uniref:Uncharacterized protein n=1 Tax=Pedobacter yonginense TaxID=651869 RepID=A0A317ELV9_9SPHI|nr:hypothetical protein [Pedobacter yonginense]PWS26883.1 hypothetical protein DHW03_12720 [Pedobacter yonginense]
MQPIQDKDFDQLFKDAFADAEVAPSRDLWSSIESEIEPKKKRMLPIFWLSAAAVLLMATVGFLVYQQQESQPKQLANNIEPKKNQPITDNKASIDAPKTVVVPAEEVATVIKASAKPAGAVVKTKMGNDVQPFEKKKMFTAPEMQKQESTIAKVEQPKQELIKKKIEEAIQQPSATVIAMVETPAEDVISDDDQSNKAIRNVGDVVNLIVNKVDKRKDKFIQFRTDDDDSSLSSINIGPFKFGKKNKK